MTIAPQARQCFLEQYRQVRHAEGRGSQDPAYYRALPYEDLSGRNQEMWAMRARTYRYFERRILRGVEKQAKRPLDILDLGAGNCWMSYRLSLRDHCPTALDIFNDSLDGLNAARFYPKPISVVEAEFDYLPFAPESFDVAVYNASIHYSANYKKTLLAVKRCLRPSGQIVILDSPIYARREHGERMVEERKSSFQARYGFPSDALNSIEFLDEPTVRRLAAELHIQWRIYRPWYGWRWHLRPIKAAVQGRRPPSHFWILAGRFHAL